MSPRGVPTGEVWLPDIEPPGDWVDRAACRGRGDESWFPAVGARSRYRAAVAVCEGCPVRQPCLEYAVANRIQYGVWGGLNEDARKRLRGVVPRARRPTPGHATESRYSYGCHCDECREAHRVATARRRAVARERQAGHAYVEELVCFALLVLFIVVGLRLVGMAW